MISRMILVVLYFSRLLACFCIHSCNYKMQDKEGTLYSSRPLIWTTWKSLKRSIGGGNENAFYTLPFFAKGKTTKLYCKWGKLLFIDKNEHKQSQEIILFSVNQLNLRNICLSCHFLPQLKIWNMVKSLESSLLNMGLMVLSWRSSLFLNYGSFWRFSPSNCGCYCLLPAILEHTCQHSRFTKKLGL